jgi:pilus assembly protein CpaE
MSEDKGIAVVVGHSAWNDLQMMGRALEEAGIGLLAVVSGAAELADQARTLGADCVLFSPTLPGMKPALVQELLLHEDGSIAAVGLIPAGSGYAAEYQRFGMKGYVTTPLDPTQVQRLPDLVEEAVHLAEEERQSRSFTPVTAEDALSILDRGGWQQQTVAVYSPKGGVGKTTVATNLAAALGVKAQRPTLLIDGDMSRANLHVLLDLDIDREPKNLFSLYDRVIARGNRTGRYVVRAETLQGHVRQWRNKLYLLPGIPKMHIAGMSEFVEDQDRTMDIFAEIVREARGFWEFRVVDVGPDFNMPIHWSAIENADTVLLVATPERTTITDVRNILPALEKAFGTLQKFKLVLNGFDERFGISPKEVVKFLGGKVTIVGTLPWAPEKARLAINTGSPFVLEKKLPPIGEAAIDLATTFYPPLEALGRKTARENGRGPLGKLAGMFAR